MTYNAKLERSEMAVYTVAYITLWGNQEVVHSFVVVTMLYRPSDLRTNIHELTYVGLLPLSVMAVKNLNKNR